MDRRDTAVASYLDADGLRCVDIVLTPAGMFTFKTFRRDPEDRGRWTLTADYSDMTFATEADALRSARAAVGWLVETREPPLEP